MTTIIDWVRLQGRGVLPKEVHKAFPERTAQQVSDCLSDYVKRGKMSKILIPSAGRRYRYKAVEKVCKTKEKWGKSEVKPELLPRITL